MEDEKLHFRDLMLYGFQKDLNIGTVTKFFFEIRSFDHVSALSMIKMCRTCA